MEKYKVTQEFMDALVEWRNVKGVDATSGDFSAYVNGKDISDLPNKIQDWWAGSIDEPVENNRRLLSIIQWLNGEDVFEVEKPHKFVVKSVWKDEHGNRYFMELFKQSSQITYPTYISNFSSATQFDSSMSAELWTTNGYEVVEIDGDGNEV